LRQEKHLEGMIDDLAFVIVDSKYGGRSCDLLKMNHCWIMTLIYIAAYNMYVFVPIALNRVRKQQISVVAVFLIFTQACGNSMSRSRSDP